MGPFVPDIISNELNLIVALLLGIGFGFVLEQAGFSSSRRLAGVFYGYDFTVLRVFFTAAVTAMSGVLLLDAAGLLDTDAIFINPTWLLPAVVGGVVMGLGFILGGYCPGTSLCAAAIGKIDAMFFVGGGILGVLAFGEAYPLLKEFNESTSLGPVRVFASLGMAEGWFAFLLILMALIAFAVTTKIERRVSPGTAPSLAFVTRKHAAAAAVLLLVGGLLVSLPDRKARLIDMVTSPAFAAEHPVQLMEADELAFRIVDREPRIQIVDLRPEEEFARLALPGSTRVSLRDLFGKEWVIPFSRRHVKKVVVGPTEEEGRAGGLLLRELGYENIAVLRGGFEEFDRTILTPPPFVLAGGRHDRTVAEFREKARAEIRRMVEESKRIAPKQAAKPKKVQGGC